MKEKLIKIILSYCDEDLRIINLPDMINEICRLDNWFTDAVDWAGLNPVKWGELRTQGDINMEEI